jgi:exopolyphosphatase/guanosine-5'-triphosphate,3'-diphosphate pyrophosphatase
MDTALHGTWVGITSAERAMLAAALWGVNGGNWPGGEATAILHLLATPSQLELARRWGLAMRLGQRLGGGAAAPLRAARLAREGNALLLSLGPDDAALYGEPVQRRHRALAQALGLEPRLRLG